MPKVDFSFIKEAFNEKVTSEEYRDAVNEIGLWKSEEIIFNRYIEKKNKILDIGCGAGRTTFSLYELGYKNIQGIDLSEVMIENAKKLNEIKGYEIDFTIGNAIRLPYEKGCFDAVIFSFNGFMQIPGESNRIRALKEIHRVLKNGGVFIFTTHNRGNSNYLEYWKEEEKRWRKNNNDPKLLEFGDRIIPNKERESFIHIPTLEEVMRLLRRGEFNIIECTSRSVLCEESEKVKEFSTECIFWVVEKL